MKNTLKKIVGLLLAGVMTISLVSCGGEAPKEEKKLSKKEQSIVDAEETVKKGFELLNKCDFKGAQKYMDVEYIENFIESEQVHCGIGTDAFMNEWMKTVSFEYVSSEYIDKNTVEVYGKVTARDQAEFLLKSLEVMTNEARNNPHKYINSDALVAAATNFVLKENTYQTTISTVTITVIRENDKWFAKVNPDLVDAIHGGYINGIEAAYGIKVIPPEE